MVAPIDGKVVPTSREQNKLVCHHCVAERDGVFRRVELVYEDPALWSNLEGGRGKGREEGEKEGWGGTIICELSHMVRGFPLFTWEKFLCWMKCITLSYCF